MINTANPKMYSFMLSIDDEDEKKKIRNNDESKTGSMETKRKYEEEEEEKEIFDYFLVYDGLDSCALIHGKCPYKTDETNV